MITRLLVSNRGEIARRVFATCRRLGIGTVAVHSDPDAGLRFVREADVAVRLPGCTPAETYLRGDLLVQAALDAGADAVHPGYGFGSEDPGFARLVLEAGLVWVGPTPASMEQMASKVAAKRLMAAAGVPVLPELDPAEVTEADLPLLVKASAGGGGRGMRRVHLLAALPEAVRSASEEAASAFGDATVFCEPYLESGRHVEVQLLGDTHGAVVVVGDRDCSVQRRHQKVVEEAPAPGLPEEVRAALHDAARAAGEAIGYVGAGTVEFLLEGSRFFFLETNTRLQVEHPVTEAVSGLDLVEQQLLLAEGAHVPAVGPVEGHAVEVRLYAEDPAHDWRPQSGRLTRVEIEHEVAFGPLNRPGLRLDAGFGTGDEVGTHYDAMLAKLVSWAPTREVAVRRLAAALARARLHGLRTNRDLLVEVLRHPAFAAGGVGTDFLGATELAALDPEAPGLPDEPRRSALLLAAAVAVTELAAATRPVQQGVPSGWRNVVSAPQVTRFALDGTALDVGWHAGRDGYRLADRADPPDPPDLADPTGLPGEAARSGGFPATRATRGERLEDRVRVVVEQAGASYPCEVFVVGDRVDVESPWGHVALTREPRFADPATQVAGGSLLAPLPGSVVALHVRTGDTVLAGAPVLVLEAMKMQHTVAAPHDGTVSEVSVTVGDQVAAGAVLAVVGQAVDEQAVDEQAVDEQAVDEQAETRGDS